MIFYPNFYRILLVCLTRNKIIFFQLKTISVFIILVLTTENGISQQWIQQTSGTTNALYGVAFVNTQIGWAVGDYGTILHTTDGGINWTQQNSGVNSWLTGITCTDSDNCWITSVRTIDSGIILHTTNGGANWNEQSVDTANALHSITFPDNHNGWAVGKNGTILHTTNGGNNWNFQSSGSRSLFRGVSFVDTNNGWVVGEYDSLGRQILHTTNGGITWTNQPPRFVGFLYLYGVYFNDLNDGWIVGLSSVDTNYASIALHTSNGGTTWRNHSPTNHALLAVNFINPQVGWMVGYYGSHLHTTNGGNTWVTQSMNPTTWMGGVTFVDSTAGWAVGDRGAIYHMSNDSETFIEGRQEINFPSHYELPSPYPNPFNSITLIRFELPVACRVKLQVFNSLGRVVYTLADENLSAGLHELPWNADKHGSGKYYVRMSVPNYSETKPILLLK